MTDVFGKYYTTLKLGSYTRASPFAQATWNPTSIWALPLPNFLRDETSVDLSSQSLDVVGDMVNGDWQGAGAKIGSNVLANQTATLPSKVIGGMLKGSPSASLAATTPVDAVASAISTGSAMAQNPNETIIFNGPTLRSFNFSWTFNPRNSAESTNLFKFITTLKQAQLPTNVISNETSILGYPQLCQLNFYPWDTNGGTQWGWGDNSIIRIKRCFISDLVVDYMPSGVPAFFNTTAAPVATTVSISFKEMEYMLSSDWGGATGNGSIVSVLSAQGGVVAGVGEDAIKSLANTLKTLLPGSSEPVTEATQ